MGGVWENLTVAVDRVLLLDADGAVARAWHREQGEVNLYEELVLAGLPVTYDPSTETVWATGHADTLRLALDAVAGKVLVLTDRGEGVLLPADLAGQVLHWFQTHADDCE
ncbi:hypothetical protein GCM10010174_45690 [Kutzneria viridogrisea]|uniref:Uncharacterized protein n=1 Tax=Kutzneria albida DSM 43870 TaxID=1449976 RepID=W5WD46_9PSEU|nr:hypothetical protein KALB_5420 [Kutzneria albida DSM 43870]